ncbi:hypothetical protein [Bradyrhizobium sp. LHD-71]|uniref:hypothetical protein n=1 Tax=Bradyrhizobium sp. LHD-71 TaxID=3072141 RepID=UPI00280CE62C|nr:hypothetical protein [Bradyrhizobium sp. LHD-71]MDQ8728883.1 hypothetical protein [Bradyrhizobium sp. LHD-71]
MTARKSDSLSDDLGTDDSDGWLGGIVAEEDDLDRRAWWRLGLWGFAAVGAVTLGILARELPAYVQRAQVAADESAGRAKQVETTLRQMELEALRLTAAIETLNSDRDRLFTRLSAIEQGLDVVTGSIKKADEKPAIPWPDAAIAPIIAPVPATVVFAPAMPSMEQASTSPPSVADAPAAHEPRPEALAAGDANASAVEESPVAFADFGLDLGTASSVGGLRALWRGLIKAHKAQLEGLRPLIGVRERKNGLGLQLHLIAGPIKDAAAAARICTALSNASRDCTTTSFDGQRLAAEPDEKPAPSRPQKQRKTTRAVQPEAAPAKPATTTSSFATMLGFR